MDIFFADPNDTPVPPQEVRIRDFEAKQYPDGRRVAVRFALTPFLQRPNVEINIVDKDNHIVADMSVVEAISANMDFTLHIPHAEGKQVYRVDMVVFYNDLDGFDADFENLPTAEEFLGRNKKMVDRKTINLEIQPEN